MASSIAVADVLQRHVDVAGDLRAFGDRADELVAPVRRMGVEQADPEIALDRLQLAEQGGEGGAAGGVDRRARVGPLLPGVHAEEGRVLGNEVELLHALGHELARLGDHAFDRAAAVPAADLRDDAEGARVVAALGDLDVGEMARREAEARRVVVGDEGRARA